MRGAGHSTYNQDPAKRQAWLDEISSRPEISLEQLVGLFSPEFIQKIDHEQTKRFKNNPTDFVGFVALEGATKDEQRLFEIAQRNTASYDEEGEDMMFDDEIIATMTDPAIRNVFKSSEEFSQAMRLRRTVVAHYLVSMELGAGAIEVVHDISGKGAA